MCICGKCDHLESTHETIPWMKEEEKKYIHTQVESRIECKVLDENGQKYEIQGGERDTIKLMPSYKPSYKFIVVQNLSTFT